MLRAPGRLGLYLLSGSLMSIAIWGSGVGADAGVQTPGAASALDPAFLKGFQWRSIGPQRGGRSIAISGVKGRPTEGYFGATGGGLWKTTDGGEHWTPVT